MDRVRRKYEPWERRGRRCQDCGRYRRVTRITFWATGMEYVVCGECINAYREIIRSPIDARRAYR